MRARIIIALGVLAAAAIAAGGCARDDARSPSTGGMSMRNPLAPAQSTPAAPDSNPGHHPPPPGPGPHDKFSVQFAGADSAFAGQSCTTSWLFGNNGHASISVA